MRIVLTDYAGEELSLEMIDGNVGIDIVGTRVDVDPKELVDALRALDVLPKEKTPTFLPGNVREPLKPRGPYWSEQAGSMLR